MNTLRYIARIILEADTPLFVGSGDSSLLKDALVQKDFNGLPMIPGTALTGVLRHSILDVLDKQPDEKDKWWQIFGFQEKDNGLGSRLHISPAYMMITDETVAEGLGVEISESIKAKFDNLPSRQHVRIDHKGVAQSGGLFDNEVVYKGTRFKFEIELTGNKEDEAIWNKIVSKLNAPLFRIGQGTRNGYGKLKVETIKTKIFDLTNSQDFQAYSDFNPSLNDDTCLKELSLNNSDEASNLIKYNLELTPDSDFFIFSEGFGDEDVDNKPLEEEIVLYKNGTIDFVKQTVIPASSIKGAIAHRTAFHYNKLKGRFSDQLFPTLGKEIALELYTGASNKAVNKLFGLGAGFEWKKNVHEKVKNIPSTEYDEFGDARRGKVIINDLYYSDEEVKNDKIFNHVAIDRFTGGAIEGALFSEKVSRLEEDVKVILDIFVEGDQEQMALSAFENALTDITKGLLPLGGMTTKGHGIFTGTLLKNGNKIYSYDN